MHDKEAISKESNSPYNGGDDYPDDSIRHIGCRSQGSLAKKRVKPNKLKNFAGLIMGQMKKLCLIDLRFRGLVLPYLRGNHQLNGFTSFVQGYKKQLKTWYKIEEFLKTDIEYGFILTNLVIQFLADDQDISFFNEWMAKSRMLEKNKDTIRNNKAYLVQGFTDHRDILRPRNLGCSCRCC